MADKEIKSVRIRPKNAGIDERLNNLGDIKCTIIDVSGLFGKEKYEVQFIPDNRDSFRATSVEYEKKGEYKDYTVEQFLQKAISTYAIHIVGERKKGEDPNTFYEILQDPWKSTPPKRRSYGFDKYYFNNSSSMQIKWFEAKEGQSLVVGGTKWSDDEGKELDIELGMTQSTKGFITKKVEIYGDELVKSQYLSNTKVTGDPKEKFTYTKDNKFSKTGEEYQWSGLTKDIDIIQQIVSSWQSQVVNYGNFGLCDSPYRTFNNMCDKVPYISPLGPEEIISSTGPSASTGASPSVAGASGPSASGLSASKIKLNIVFPPEFEVKAREDIPEFTIYVGDVPKEVPVEGFISQDDEMTELDPEYSEDPFVGEEDTNDYPNEPLYKELELEVVQKGNEEAKQEAKKLEDSGELPPLDPNSPNPFENAKPSKAGTFDGVGFPVDTSTTNFCKKYCNGVYPAAQNPDGTFVIARAEGTPFINREKKKGVKTTRHWLKPNPDYVRMMKSVKITLSSGKTKSIEVHPEFANKLQTAFDVITKKGLNKYINSCAGGLAIRNVTNGLRLSNHAYGFAMDVNTVDDGWEFGATWDVKNKTIKNSKGKVRSWTEFDEGFYEVVKIMKNYGIGWLGSMDPMHFSIHE